MIVCSALLNIHTVSSAGISRCHDWKLHQLLDIFAVYSLCKTHVRVRRFLLSVLCLSVAPWGTTVVGKGVRSWRSAVNASPGAAAGKDKNKKTCSFWDFMFTTKRSCCIKRLASFAHEAQRTVENILKKLDSQQLENLMIAVESKGAEDAPCILLPVGEEQRPDRGYPVQPHVRFCQLWRWADLRLPQELRKLPACQTPHDSSSYICCNPFHWSRLYKPDSPPPPYTQYPQELSSSEDTAFSEPISSRYTSQLTDGSENSKPWCKIAYWELNARVGRLFQNSQSSLNVFADLPHGDGMCLETLANSHITENTSVLQTRNKIGQGITIFKEDQKVWVYNRSEHALFVNSPTLDPPNSEKFTVYKLLPGYCINIFDYDLSKANQRLRDPSSLTDGPIDEFSVRISFAKGWGSSKYSRRFITCCPCWLEVMFLVHR